jgi:hypothetical protein
MQQTTRDADALDASLIDLVVRRLNASDGAILDPARETATMRRLAAEWRSDVPAGVGLRMYRELIGAALRRHAPVSLHVADSDRDLCEAARMHFGYAMPLTVYPTSSMVVQALADDSHAIGIVPAPTSDDGQAGWWSNLSAPSGTGPRIVAKLPFFQGDGSPVRQPPCYVVASVPVAASGDDTTLVVVFLRSEMSRPRLGQVLKMTTLDAQVIAMGRDQPERSATRFLIEAAGHLSFTDSRLEALRAHGGEEIADVTIVGAYANPVVFGGSKS